MNKRKIKIAFLAALVLAFSLLGQPAPGIGGGEAAPEEEARPESPVYYTVKKGDCLWSVAEKFDISVDTLAETNGLDPESLLAEDRVLKIPRSNWITYKVSSGDTLWELARRFNTSVEGIAMVNQIGDTEILLEGAELIIPAFRMVKAERAAGIPRLSLWPVRGVISSAFGPRWGRMHEGLDIAAEKGAPIKAVEGGRVVFAGPRGRYGNAVIINHGNGFRSLYGHASRIEVAPGDDVEKGQIIARVGNTGRSTGPHLHLELLHRGVPLNPQRYLPGQHR